VKFTLHYGDAPPLKFSVPKKWLEKPLTAIVEYYVEEYYNKKFPEAPVTTAELCVKDGASKFLSLESTIVDVGAATEELYFEISSGDAPSPAPAPAPASTAAPPVSNATGQNAESAPAPKRESYTVTKDELEACFGVGAASRLLSHRRQRQIEQEGASKKAKVPVSEKPKATAMEELRTLMTAAATLMTGKGQTWNRPLVDKVYSHLEASEALQGFVAVHSAEARKKPSKELTVDSLQASLKVLATLTTNGDLAEIDAACGLVFLLAPVEAVVKFRGADSLDMLVLLQRRWNQLGPKLVAAGGEGAEIAPMVFKEIDRVASMCLKKFFQRTITDDQQEAEDKFVTVLARHMMKKLYNPKKANSVALQMAEDALDDQDQFETTSQGKELAKMFRDAAWGAKEQDLVDNVFFRCELNQGLAMYLNMNLVRLGRKVAEQPNLVVQLVNALPQTTGGDPEGIFSGLACVLACAGIAMADGNGTAVMIMLSPISQMWAQLAQHLQEIDGVQSFVELLDEYWVQATAMYLADAEALKGVEIVPLKRGDPQPSEEQMKAMMVQAVKESVLQDEFIKVLEEMPTVQGVEMKAAAAVRAAKSS